MRWQARKIGMCRIVKKFLLFPRLINSEWRWLEQVVIEQHTTKLYIGHGTTVIRWKDFEWVNE